MFSVTYWFSWSYCPTTTANIIKQQGGRALPFVADVTEHEDRNHRHGRLFAVKEFGKLDILVNNAANVPARNPPTARSSAISTRRNGTT